MKVLQEAKNVEQYIIDMRRYFHKYPELSWEEVNTSNKICEELEKMSIPYTRVCKTGIIGVIKGRSDKPIIGIRSDIDALPVEEETNLEFASQNKGVMHACGHDAHIAMLLGAAKILNKHKKELNCTIKLIFQPAEEYIKNLGAKQMMLLEEVKDIDNIVAAHIWSNLDKGTISVEAGARFASSDTFKLKIIGEGGHGAVPHQAIDPIIAASGVVNNLQSIISREISPIDPCVISVCSFKSGNSSNVIPTIATLEGTTRTFNKEVRESLPAQMERIISNTCQAFRTKFEFEYYHGVAPTINEEKSSKIAEKVVKKLLGDKGLVKYPTSMVGEDFSVYLEKIPGCIAFIGGRNEKENKIYPHHNPKFDIDESAMKIGVAFFIQYILDIQYEI